MKERADVDVVLGFLKSIGHSLMAGIRAKEGREGIGDCILGSRIAMLFAQEVGLKAEVVPCFVMALPPQWVVKMEEHNNSIADALLNPDAELWALQFGKFVSVGIPSDEKPKGLNAHLVTVIEGTHLIDLTSWQFTREDRGMNWDVPVVLKVFKRFHNGSRPEGAFRDAGKGRCAMLYGRLPGFREHMKAAAWRDNRTFEKEVLAQLMPMYREWLAGAGAVAAESGKVGVMQVEVSRA